MTESVILLLVLSAVAVCLGIITVEFSLTMRETRRVLHGLHAIVDRADQATHAVETLVRHSYAAASDLMARVEEWPHRLGALVMRRWGNGARVEPRRTSRANGKRRVRG